MKLRRAQRSKQRPSPVTTSAPSRSAGSAHRDSPTSPEPVARIAALHGAIGNQAVGRMLTSDRSRGRAVTAPNAIASMPTSNRSRARAAHATGVIAASPHRRPHAVAVRAPQRGPALQRAPASAGEISAYRAITKVLGAKAASKATRANTGIGGLTGGLKQLSNLSNAIAAEAGPLAAQLKTLSTSAKTVYSTVAKKLTQMVSDRLAHAKSAAREATTATDKGKLDTALKDAYQANVGLTAIIEQVGEKVGDLAGQAAEMARAAHKGGAAELATKIFRIADSADAVAKLDTPPPEKIDFSGGSKTHGHDTRDLGSAALDTLNNLTFGITLGTIGAIEASGVAIFGTVGAAVVGAIGGGLGVIFGLVGLTVGIHAAWRGALKEKQLKALIPTLSGTEAKGIAAYAAEQKRKKKWGGAIVAVIGGAAIVAGIAGLVALSVATMGVGAAVFAVAVAAIGVGVLVYRWLHKRSKRAKARKALRELAASLVAGAFAGDAKTKKDARQSIASYGMDADNIASLEDPQFTAALIEAMAALAMSKRAEMAERTIELLVNGSPSEQFDAERIVETLGLKPDKLRARVAAGKAATAKDRVMRKLSSW